ncbi:MAG: asparagine synthase-related protein [Methanothrix sp.]|nr:asparagine synthase-related protein [Methanothrix sp.]
MSAICGICYSDAQTVSRVILEKMIQSMIHRGPDRCDTFIQGNIGLCQAMLCTTPESRDEYQPYTECHLTIVADARIDNREILLKKLDLSKDTPDCRIILRAYHCWGEHCPKELLGDYAFAIWDDKKKRLFCARDHMGVRPLYYYRGLDQGKEIFAFSSEIKALLVLPEVRKTINEEMVANYLAATLSDREITIYKEIKRLPAAHFLMLPGKPVRYWRLDPTRTIRLSSDQDYAREFLRIFQEAVRCRIRSAFSIGSTLSGGLDSSSICSLASLALFEQGKVLHTYSAIFPDAPKCDETLYINEVLSKGNMQPHFIRADRLSPFSDIDRIFDELDEPYWMPNLFWKRAICQAAGLSGIRVLLDGFDGDTVVSHGFFLLEEMFRSLNWIDLCRELNGIKKTSRISPGKLVWSRCIAPLAPAWFARIYKKIRKHTEYDCAEPNFNRDFAKRINLKNKLNVKYTMPRTSQEDMLMTLEDGFLQYLLEVADHIAGAFSVQYGHPFFDKRVVEFCLALPSDQRLRQGYSRWIMRAALEGILPEKVRMRGDKADLSSNFDQRIISVDGDLLNDIATANNHSVWNYASFDKFTDLCSQMRSENFGDTMYLWAVANLALWLNRREREATELR